MHLRKVAFLFNLFPRKETSIDLAFYRSQATPETSNAMSSAVRSTSSSRRRGVVSGSGTSFLKNRFQGRCLSEREQRGNRRHGGGGRNVLTQALSVEETVVEEMFCVAQETGADGSTLFKFSEEEPVVMEEVDESSAELVNLAEDEEAISKGEEETSPQADDSSPESAEKKKKFRSSWDAPSQKKGSKEKGGDYLYELGASDYQNLNIDVGQTSKYQGDNLFTLDCTADIADGSLRKFELRKFMNIKGDYWIPPRFQDKVVLHLTKNMLKDTTDFMPITPLILGIFGGKGQGKSFTVELILKRLGVEAVVMSAGELEDEVAGRPARLIRERYRKAADMSKCRGKLTCLVINDIDAGVGNYAETQKTVNSQMVVGTLMNLCDNPKQVSVGQKWWGKDIIRRCPIIVTGNDLNTVYAPLLRDGRMEKFYWDPTEEDRFNMVYTMFKDDNVPPEHIELLMKTFSNQGKVDF